MEMLFWWCAFSWYYFASLFYTLPHEEMVGYYVMGSVRPSFWFLSIILRIIQWNLFGGLSC